MNDFIRDFLIGGVSFAVSKSTDTPKQRIKILFKHQDVGLYGCFIRLLKEEPLSTFWRGHLPYLRLYVPNAAFNFAFNDVYKILFRSFDPKREKLNFFLVNMLSGGAAGGTTLLLIYPLQFARNKLAIENQNKVERQFNSLKDCVRKIYKSDGLKGLYRGLRISALEVIVYRSISFGCYDTAKGTIFKNSMMSNVGVKFIVAYFIHCTSSIMSSPFNIIRRRMIMQQRSSNIHYKNNLDCAVQILNKEGLNSFFKGALSQSFFGSRSALSLVIYDEIKQFLSPGSNIKEGQDRD
ncbi:unnamed protein product [Paramecium octaurelia]|uniref:ADP/ATP translocase n=1 Tax=Paramecium octaurelia TaxID=43137 RepID=A0A8S1XI85_PAROT|nr:unnamed protein product [Paramecium octaurelia]